MDLLWVASPGAQLLYWKSCEDRDWASFVCHSLLNTKYESGPKMAVEKYGGPCDWDNPGLPVSRWEVLSTIIWSSLAYEHGHGGPGSERNQSVKGMNFLAAKNTTLPHTTVLTILVLFVKFPPFGVTHKALLPACGVGVRLLAWRPGREVWQLRQWCWCGVGHFVFLVLLIIYCRIISYLKT